MVRQADPLSRETLPAGHVVLPAVPRAVQDLALPVPPEVGLASLAVVRGEGGSREDPLAARSALVEAPVEVGVELAVVAEDDAGNRSPLTTSARKAILVKDIEIEEGGITVGENWSTSETRFVLNETQEVRITLYDLLGRRVRVVEDREFRSGFEQIVRFQTSSLSSGPYFLRFKGERFAATRKIVVVQ